MGFIYQSFTGLTTILGFIKIYNFHSGVSIRIFNMGFWSHHIGERYIWFRIFGNGLLIKHKCYGLTYSQRSGTSKPFIVGRFIIVKLKK